VPDEVCTLQELVDRVEFDNVVIHHLEGTRNNQGAREAAETLNPSPTELVDERRNDLVSFNATARLDEFELGVRCEIVANNDHGTFAVDGEVIFSMSEPIDDLDPALMREFTERIGVMALYPYLRSASAACAAQLALPAPCIPLLRAGDLQLEEAGEPQVIVTNTVNDDTHVFATFDEARLACEMDDALRGNTAPIRWMDVALIGEPAPGYEYTIYDIGDGTFEVAFEGPGHPLKLLPGSFTSIEAAQGFCELDCNQRIPRQE